MFSVVKLMKEQGNQFDWSQIAIDIPSLPCFDQSKVDEALEKAVSGQEPMGVEDILSEGYVLVNLMVGRFTYSLVVKQTGDNPSASSGPDGLDFVDCEPVKFFKVDQLLGGGPVLPITPVRAFMYDTTATNEPIPVLGVEESFWPFFRGVAIVVGPDNFLCLAFNRESMA